jgi:hypothetical protein
MQSISNQSLLGIPLVTGKRTGNFTETGRSQPMDSLKSPTPRRFVEQFPKSKNREYFCEEQGMDDEEQGISPTEVPGEREA